MKTEPNIRFTVDEFKVMSRSRDWTFRGSDSLTWALAAVSLFLGLVAPIIVVALQSKWAVRIQMKERDQVLQLCFITKCSNLCG